VESSIMVAKYYNEMGKLLWKERYIFRNKYKDGQLFVSNYVNYLVISSSLTKRTYNIIVKR
jgi:hypothetical protein